MVVELVDAETGRQGDASQFQAPLRAAEQAPLRVVEVDCQP